MRECHSNAAGGRRYRCSIDGRQDRHHGDHQVQQHGEVVVDVQYGWVGGARHFAGARIVDGRTGESLLTVDHPKTVWLNADDAVIYPMLNDLRKWRKRVDSQSS
jgi:hypothetical protein